MAPSYSQLAPTDVPTADLNIDRPVSPAGEGAIHPGTGLNAGPGTGMQYFTRPINNWVGPTQVDYSKLGIVYEYRFIHHGEEMVVFSVVYQITLPNGQGGIATDWISKEFIGNYLYHEWVAAKRIIDGQPDAESIWSHDAIFQELRALVKREADQQRRDLKEFLSWGELDIVKALTALLTQHVNNFYAAKIAKEHMEYREAKPLFDEFTNS